MRRHPHTNQPMQDPGGLLLRKQAHYQKHTSVIGSIFNFLWTVGLVLLGLFVLANLAK